MLKANPDVLMVHKSTIPVGYAESVREDYGVKNIISVQNFFVNPRNFMITVILAALLLAVMIIRGKKVRCLQIFF